MSVPKARGVEIANELFCARAREEKVLESHSAWEVIWWFHYQKKPGDYNVIVIVDAEMAKIIHETKGIALG